MAESGHVQSPAWAAGSPTRAARLRKSESLRLGFRDVPGGVELYCVQTTSTFSQAERLDEDRTLFMRENSPPRECVRGSDRGMRSGPEPPMFGPETLPGTLHSTLATRPEAAPADEECASAQQEGTAPDAGGAAQDVVWLQMKAWEQQVENQIAHERLERCSAWEKANESAQLLKGREDEAAGQKRRIEQMTSRLQELQEQEGMEAQTEELRAKADELSGEIVATQQRLGDSEESARKLATQLEENERGRQTDLAAYLQERDSLKRASQAQLDEQARHHEAALVGARRRHADLQAQLAQKAAEHGDSEKLAAELRTQLGHLEVNYSKVMASISQVLQQPLLQKAIQT